MTKFKIEDGISMPSKSGRPLSGLSETLMKMEVGQSVLVPNATSHTVGGFFAFVHKKTGYTFASRKQGADVRVWRLT